MIKVIGLNTKVLKKEPLFYRDGAHNPDGACKLASFLQKHFTNKRIIYIMGVLKDKEYTKILQYLMPMAKKVMYLDRIMNGGFQQKF